MDRQEQYERFVNHVGIVRLEPRTHIEIRGEDRASFLHSFCTNDIVRLTPGQGCEAFVTTVQGKIIAHLLVFCAPGALHLETVPGQGPDLIAHLDRYLIREAVQLVDRTDETSQMLLSGEDAASLLRQLVGKVPENEYAHVAAELGGKPIFLRRAPITGPTCVLARVARSDGQLAFDLLIEAGATACDVEIAEIARVENSWPEYGKDITDRNLPQEVGRDRLAISFTKGCYLGQEPIARIDALGHVNKWLVQLRFDQEEVPRPGTELIAAGKVVGGVTSAVRSPRFAAPLALGYIRRELCELGMRFESPGGEAEIVALPEP